jgi:phosphoenolpyruvate-protein kinase (PTS system EI component)
VAFGPAFILASNQTGVEVYPLRTAQVAAEINRLREAVEQTRVDIQHARDEFASAVDPGLAQIFDGHEWV